MKHFYTGLIVGLLMLAAQLSAGSFKTYGKVKVVKNAAGTYTATFQTDKGWPQIHFSVPQGAWGAGQIKMTIRQVAPQGKLPVNFIIGTMPRNAKALQGGYITHKLAPNKMVSLKFAEIGNKAPDAIMLAAKSPKCPVVLEFSLPEKISDKTK